MKTRLTFVGIIIRTCVGVAHSAVMRDVSAVGILSDDGYMGISADLLAAD